MAKGYAIIMMLQGHTIDSVLLPELRTEASMLYIVWTYLRGITAPLFLVCSGLLIGHIYNSKCKVQTSGEAGNRFLSLTAKRGVQLIIVGYLLRLSLGAIYSFGDMGDPGFSYFLTIHILHVIGVSLLLCAAFLRITNKLALGIKTASILSIGALVFMAESYFGELDYSLWPEAIANYFTKENGSVFKLVPWVGYMFFGLGVGLMNKKIISNQKFLLTIGAGLISLGYITNLYPAEAVIGDNRIDLFSYRYIWLGWAFVILALSLFFYQSFGKIKFLAWMGKNTFVLYFLHEVFLFGALTGIGLAKVFYESMSWLESAVLAICIVIIVALSTVILKRFYNKYIST